MWTSGGLGKVLAALVKVAVGAMYLDGGSEAAKRVVAALGMLEGAPSWFDYWTWSIDDVVGLDVSRAVFTVALVFLDSKVP